MPAEDKEYAKRTSLGAKWGLKLPVLDRVTNSQTYADKGKQTNSDNTQNNINIAIAIEVRQISEWTL